MVLFDAHWPTTKGSAKVLLDFREYENPGSLKYDGACCDGEFTKQNCTSFCDYSVSVCIDSQYVLCSSSTLVCSTNLRCDMSILRNPPTPMLIPRGEPPCSVHRHDLGYLVSGKASFAFPHTFHDGYSNPVPVDIDKWEGSVQITVIVYDQDTSDEQLVDYFSFSFSLVSPVKERVAVASDYTNFTLAGTRPFQKSRLKIGVTAQCDRFFYTDTCDVNCVPSDDCLGHYTCDVTDGSKICLDGWAGEHCNISISETFNCSAAYCQYQGVCVQYGDRSDQVYCCCHAGYAGERCEEDVDECATDPCRNGGVCVQGMPPLFSCQCPTGWKGSVCEEEETCADQPCQNGGMCRSLPRQPQRPLYTCECGTSFMGEKCELPLTTTALGTSPTFPPSTVTSPTDQTMKFTLPLQMGECYGNYCGSKCETHCRSTDDCSGHYHCDGTTGQKLCKPGWTPDSNCTRRSFPEPDCQCQNEGECFAGGCCCPSGFSGPWCTQASSACLSNPCRNGGTCMLGVLSDTEACVCPEMFSGHLCELMVAPNRNCQAGYFGPRCETYCTPQLECGISGQYVCDEISGEKICMFGWLGELCDTPASNVSHHEPCPDSVCRHGVCVDGVCCCEPGYTGTLCHTQILECLHQPCLNGGKCIDKINWYQCDCPSGYAGVNCELKTTSGENNTVVNLPCSTNVCRNSGSCVPIGNSDFYCECTERYVGIMCDIYVPNNSNNQLCPDFHFGADCSVRCEESDSCGGGHFYCDSNSGDKICRNGWGGTDCNIRLVPSGDDPSCPSGGSSCQNGGSCFNGSCCCTDDYHGTFCHSEILPCDRQLLYNYNLCGDHGNCVDLENINFTCRCDAGFFGTRCELRQSISTILPIATVIEPSSTAATKSEPTYPPEKCGDFLCYNGVSLVDDEIYTTTPGISVSTMIPEASDSSSIHSPDAMISVSPSSTAPESSNYVASKDNSTHTETPTLQNMYQGSVFIAGTVPYSEMSALVEQINAALLDTTSDIECCLTVKLDENNVYFSNQGNPLICLNYNYLVRMAHIDPLLRRKRDELGMTGGTTSKAFQAHHSKPLQTTVSEETAARINNVLAKIGQTIHVYTGLVFGGDLLFFVDVVGSVAREMFPAFETCLVNAWINQNSDCECQMETRVLSSHGFIGRYGTQLVRLYYTITWGGEWQRTTSGRAPSDEQLALELANNRLNKLYTQSDVAVSTSMLYRFPLKSIVSFKSEDGRQIQEKLTFVWNQYQGDESQVTVTLVDNQLHYTRGGADISYVGYFVTIDGNFKNPSRDAGPSTAAEACRCDHKPALRLLAKGRANYFTAGRVIRELTEGGQIVFREWFYDFDRGGPVSMLYFTVSVDEADSKLTLAEEPSPDELRKHFGLLSASSVTLCATRCIRTLRTLQVFLDETISNVNETGDQLTSALTTALHDAWTTANEEFSGAIEVDIHNITETSGDTNTTTRDRSANVRYSLKLLGGQRQVSDQDLFSPTNEVIELAIKKEDVGVSVFHQEANSNDDDSFPWYIPVGVILALLLTGLIILVFLLITKDARHKDSRLVRQEPPATMDFDKEHFAREPDIPNPTFAPEEAELDDVKTSTYIVNPYQLEDPDAFQN
ncbi:hypothetical protein EGW08_012369 [Elysia chlorotica]|uniref:Delta-like protein n=1 Tax=Elysia chlorotica TaxID=188477 RepID=A0A433TEA6_ELYCH|nr:hypothetical protein EGW08_012369 [Elysia chlorotica]